MFLFKWKSLDLARVKKIKNEQCFITGLKKPSYCALVIWLQRCTDRNHYHIIMTKHKSKLYVRQYCSSSPSGHSGIPLQCRLRRIQLPSEHMNSCFSPLLCSLQDGCDGMHLRRPDRWSSLGWKLISTELSLISCFCSKATTTNQKDIIYQTKPFIVIFISSTHHCTHIILLSFLFNNLRCRCNETKTAVNQRKQINWRFMTFRSHHLFYIKKSQIR